MHGTRLRELARGMGAHQRVSYLTVPWRAQGSVLLSVYFGRWPLSHLLSLSLSRAISMDVPPPLEVFTRVRDEPLVDRRALRCVSGEREEMALRRTWIFWITKRSCT